MSHTASDLAPGVRPYREEDEGPVLEVLRASLGEGPTGHRSSRFFRWKHLENPFGRSLLLVAEVSGRPVGLRAFMRWRLRAGDRAVAALRAVDTATHPEFQGRGIFSRLTLEALAAARTEADLVFNTPNEKSLPGYLKMGWRVAGRVPISVRVRRPLRFLRDARRVRASDGGGSPTLPVHAVRAAEALADGDEVAELLEAARLPGQRLSTARDVDYLRWRYGPASGLDYRAIREDRGGRLRGLALFRVRRRAALWEATVAEVMVAPGDGRTARRLLRGVVAAAPVDHLTGHFPRGSAVARAARWTRFVRAPGGMTFVVHPLRAVEPDPTTLSSWALSLGDLEVL